MVKIGSTQVSQLVAMLEAAPPQEGVFNPWVDVDPENDLGAACPQIRREQLGHYLAVRQGQARYLFIGEALGYQGGHFSGVPMTSERILLGALAGRGIQPAYVLPGLQPRRTSKPALKSAGFSEPTATIVWDALLGAGLSGTQFVLWNAFPWHPYDRSRGLLSNRKPQPWELEFGEPALRAMIALYPQATVVAVGNVAAEALSRVGVEFRPVRHPARGGAEAFRQGCLDLVGLLGRVSPAPTAS